MNRYYRGMRLHRVTILSAAVLTLAGLSGRAAGAPEICSTLKEGGAGASMFTPYVAWGSGTADVDARLAVMDAAGEPPAEIEDAWGTWSTHLEAIREVEDTGSNPADAIADGSSGDAADAGSELSSFYSDSCL